MEKNTFKVPRFDASGRRKGKRIFVQLSQGISKLPDKTAKVCPSCGKTRVRKHNLTTPLRFEECRSDLPVMQPRVSTKNTWWNKGIIRYFIAPDDSLPWFEHWCIASCPSDGTGRVCELNYKRQFGRLRLLILCCQGLVGFGDLLKWKREHHSRRISRDFAKVL